MSNSSRCISAAVCYVVPWDAFAAAEVVQSWPAWRHPRTERWDLFGARRRELGLFKRVQPRRVRLSLGYRESVRLPRERWVPRLLCICRYLCFESLRLGPGGVGALRQVRGTKKREEIVAPSLSSVARCVRVNLRTRGRPGTLPRVLSSFIASPPWSSRSPPVQLLSCSSKSFEHDREKFAISPGLLTY